MTTDPKAIWARLAVGANLDGLEIERVEGRCHVRQLQTQPARSTRVRGLPEGVELLEGVIELKNVSIKDVYFDECRLRDLRLHDVTFENCVFSKCDLQGLRMWRTTFANCRLVDVDLRRSSLGAVDKSGLANTFRGVELVRVNMRENQFISAVMTDCQFRDCDLKTVNFDGTRFERCTFSGLLDEVQFYPHPFGEEHLPRNEMKDVSFADARFRFVEFRKLDMEHVVWPTAEDHIVVRNYRATLACMAKRLAALGTKLGTRAANSLMFKLKWAGDHQKTGVLTPTSFPQEGEWEAVLQALAECAPRN